MLKRCIGLLVVVMASMIGVRAQDTPSTAPIIALAKGDFWAINPDDGSLTQITQHRQDLYYDQPGSQRDLAISPDGQYLAYVQTPRFFAIAMKNNLVGNIGFAPSDIVLLNLKTGEEKVIAGQQPNVTYADGPRLWYRRSLKWSPDGSQLAYYQYRGVQGEASFQSQVMIYDWFVDRTVTFVDSDGYLDTVAWLREGIGVGSTIYDRDSRPISRYYLNEWMTFVQPLTYQGEEYAIVDSADVIPHDGQVYVMHMHSGAYGVVDGYQSSISATAPEDSLVFVEDDNDTRPSYVIDPQTGSRFLPPRQAPYAVDFTFAPDGRRFAYVLIGTSVNISDLSGREVVVDLAANTIIWGGKQYTVATEDGRQDAPVVATSAFDNATRCGVLAPVGLVAGGTGQVIVGGGPNRIRSAPNTEGEVIGQIPEGATFGVVAGQQGVCANGIRWAQVQFEGVTGWTAEGADGQMFLAPVPG